MFVCVYIYIFVLINFPLSRSRLKGKHVFSAFCAYFIFGCLRLPLSLLATCDLIFTYIMHIYLYYVLQC
ncbi:hypothetical protein T492DRAFT_1037689 [Pavlovales sp. CCMP2436]|nr:hypothetical protein T492DRAFT_1037689 [Pavlovales sp. CCMP2436]